LYSPTLYMEKNKVYSSGGALESMVAYFLNK